LDKFCQLNIEFFFVWENNICIFEQNYFMHSILICLLEIKQRLETFLDTWVLSTFEYLWFEQRRSSPRWAGDSLDVEIEVLLDNFTDVMPYHLGVVYLVPDKDKNL